MRRVSESQLAEVLGQLPDVTRVVASGNHVAPLHVLSIVDGALAAYRLYMLNAPRGIPDREGVTYETSFVGAGMREPSTADLLPESAVAGAGAVAGPARPRRCGPPHHAAVVGYRQPRVEVNILPAAIEAVRGRGGLVVAQANAQMPTTFGDAVLSLDAIDYLVEVDEPLPVPATRERDPVAATVGERVAALVTEHATLQLGIGAIPDATLHALAGRRGLRVWSEMFSDGVLALEKAGCLDPDSPVTASFCFGSAELYDWVNHNGRIRMLRTEKTNDPALIAAIPTWCR
jgi:hypothetical protein